MLSGLKPPSGPARTRMAPPISTQYSQMDMRGMYRSAAEAGRAGVGDAECALWW